MATHLTPEQRAKREATNKRILKVFGGLLGAVLVLVLLGVMLGGGEEEARPQAQSSSPATSSAPSVEPSVARSPSSEPSPAPVADQFDELKTYMEENFSTATWYGNITGYESFAGDSIQVTTNLFADGDARLPADAMCAAVSQFLLAQDKEPRVRVAASDGQGVALRTGLTDQCAP